MRNDNETLSNILITLNNLSMSFGNFKALNNITLTVNKGECIGIVGHNGAGKSTLVNVINSKLSPTSGSITYNQVHLDNVPNKIKADLSGIRCVYQELSLCPNLTVLENFMIPFRYVKGFFWRKKIEALALASMDKIFPGHNIAAKSVVGDLSIAERQMVEISIAFSVREINPSLVILDEPTSSLDAKIAQQLLDYIKEYCKSGGSIIFISHMLGEIFDVANRIVLMKDGAITKIKPTNDFTRESLVEAMGHIVKDPLKIKYNRNIGSQVLNTSFGIDARKSEIVGLAGLAGHGQAEALAKIYMKESSLWRDNRAPKVAFVAGDRERDGIMPLWSITKNISLTTLSEFGNKGLVNKKQEQKLALNWFEKLKIRTENLNNLIISLSGGNQQKALFAKALISSASIVLMDDPMRGVDVATKEDVYKMIQEEALNGRTFVWYSTETDEICQCDRVFVFRKGSISAELIGDEINEDNILRASFEMQEEEA